MGKYRATLNMAGAKRGQVVTLSDTEPRTIRLVNEGHLVPVEVDAEAIKRFESARAEAAKPADNSIEQVRAALEERRREAAAAAEAETSAVATAQTDESVLPAEEQDDDEGVVDAITEDVAEESSDDSEDDESEPSSEPSSSSRSRTSNRSRTGAKRKGS